jgi:hypothetical protein
VKESWEIHWKDYFKILQIDPLAEPEVVKAAFDKLIFKYHPDRNKEPKADERTKNLIEAFDILKNTEKRMRYYTAYLQRQAAEPTTFYPPPPPKAKVAPKATPSVASEVIQSRWCPTCKQNTNMKIGFLNKKPTFGRCPQCHTLWDLRPQVRYTSTYNIDELTPDVKQRLEHLRNKKRFK